MGSLFDGLFLQSAADSILKFTGVKPGVRSRKSEINKQFQESMAERESYTPLFTIVRESSQTRAFLRFCGLSCLLTFAAIRHYPASFVGKIVGKEWAELRSACQH